MRAPGARSRRPKWRTAALTLWRDCYRFELAEASAARKASTTKMNVVAPIFMVISAIGLPPERTFGLRSQVGW